MVRLGKIKIPNEYVRGVYASIGGRVVVQGAILDEDITDGWFDSIKEFEVGEVMQLESSKISGVVTINSSPEIETKRVGKKEKMLYSFSLDLKIIA